MNKLIFDVNNGRKMMVRQHNGKILIDKPDGTSILCSEGDFVMAINLIRYMKWENQNTVYLKDDTGNYEDFRLLD